MQRHLIYVPDPAYYSPADAGLADIAEVRLDTPDGERLIAWWARPPPASRPCFISTAMPAVFTQGPTVSVASPRRGSASSWSLIAAIPAAPASPRRRAVVADALLAYDHLRREGIAPSDIAPMGESLGSGVAVQLAASRLVGALILDAPYTSLADIGKTLYPYMPVDLFIADRFDSKRHIQSVKAPILVLHGTRDTTIPISFGKALFEAAPEPKEMAVLTGAGHSDIYLFGALERIADFLARYRATGNRRSGSGSGPPD
ncbi:MAG: alpha/beta hydrolase [Rhodomicrobium sp.]|nr:alpha/beta hydrolase [Rhodomicrobium sp.]